LRLFEHTSDFDLHDLCGWHAENTPSQIIDKLNDAINAGLADPKIKARLAIKWTVLQSITLALPKARRKEQTCWYVRFGPKSDLLGVRHVSIIITPSIRRPDRHLADKSLSTGRLSEYPTDYFVGICIETSAMAEQNTLWLPRVDFPNCRLRLLPLEE
jgi:hypothetical protein